MEFFNKLHEELINKIMIIYWKEIFNENIIKKFNETSILINMIHNYMFRHGIPNILIGFCNPTDKLHYHYFKKHNKILFELFNENNLLKYKNLYRNINNIISYGMLNNISNSYKYICAYYIINSFQSSKKILKYFENFP